MSVEQMRKAIKEVYPGPSWQNKVSQMKDGQIIAVYYTFLNQKKLK